jgi:RHS repeat-associated protein
MQLDGRSTNYGSANEKYKFTGKERDVETGYDYFGARYYDSRIGRWLSVDPLAEKYPSWSPYNYTLNNPIKNFDPNGEWSESFHNKFLEMAFPFAKNLQALKDASAYADERKFQKGEYSYRHAMRAERQTRQDAMKNFMNFLNTPGGSDPKTGEKWNKDTELGVKLHAIMDYFCPSHEGFQEWPENTVEQAYEYINGHVQGDYDDSNDKRREAMLITMNKFKDAFEKGKDFTWNDIDASSWSSGYLTEQIATWRKQGYIVIVDGVVQP